VPKQAFSLTLSSGGVFATSLAVQLIGFAGSVILYKYYAIGDARTALLGTAQFFLLIASSINGIGDLRIGTAYTYFLARGMPPRQTTATYLLLRVMMVGGIGLFLVVIAPLSLGVGPIAPPGIMFETLALFLVLPIFWSISTVYNQTYIGSGNSLRAQYPSLIEAIARVPAIYWVTFHNPTILTIAAAYAVGAGVAAAFSLPSLWPRLAGFRKVEALRMFRFAWPLMASLLLNYVVTNTVPLLVKIGVSAEAFSWFLAANGWRVLVLSLPAAITTPLFPYLAGLHRLERWEAIRTGTWQALRYSSMLLVPGVIALFVYRFNFLDDFANHSYAVQGSTALAILAIGALPLALSQIIQSSINAIGRQRLELYITITQILVLLGGIGLLMPPWGPFPIHPGIVAGAVAILLSSVAALALNTYFMESLIRVHIHPASIAGITVSAAGAFGALVALNRFHLFPVSSSVELLAAVLVGFVVYFVILALIGELSRDDVRRIGHSLGLPRSVVEAVGRIPWRDRSPDLAPLTDLTLAPGLRSTELPEAFTGMREMPEVGDAPIPGDGPREPPD
jgi:O-antigen/teichoic acid export membrane protein